MDTHPTTKPPVRTAWAAVLWAALLAGGAAVTAAEAPSGARNDYLAIVKAYADTMIEKGRDTYGTVPSPLFATTLDRKTHKLFDSEPPNIPGIREQDRSWRGANPMQDENLYQVLYALTNEAFRELALKAAVRYLTSDPPANAVIFPGALGDAIWLLFDAHALTKDPKYLARADDLAQLAMKTVMDPSSPLPKASSRHEHYEAITRADTLMMALLRLWATHQGTADGLKMVYTDVGQ